MEFKSKLLRKQRESLLCIGLDTLLDKIPVFLRSSEDAIFEFNKRIINSTCDLVCAYKLNLGFYLSSGAKGVEALTRTVAYIPRDIPVICDAKFCDVGHASKVYAKAVFETYGFDAVTVNPYLGRDGVQPFLEYEDKGVFLICRTSNKSALELQHLKFKDGVELFEIVARKAMEWNEKGNLGLVVGALSPEALKRAREIVGEEMQILIPGIGAQCGDLECAVKFGTNSSGDKAIINSARAIIYAGEAEDFDSTAREAAYALKSEIDRLRRKKQCKL
ncbi:MAG: orotidine-5'-phosphate decarboxylase [Methanocellales archaeon]